MTAPTSGNDRAEAMKRLKDALDRLGRGPGTEPDPTRVAIKTALMAVEDVLKIDGGTS
jgi:translation elongation factor EF-Tu-like GTPase